MSRLANVLEKPQLPRGGANVFVPARLAQVSQPAVSPIFESAACRKGASLAAKSGRADLPVSRPGKPYGRLGSLRCKIAYEITSGWSGVQAKEIL